MDPIEEYIDIISPGGDVTGVSKPRSEVHQAGDWHRSIHVWILNDARELLIQRRAFEKENHPGLWDVSCAGHITAGDSSRQAAVRELTEELGLTIQPTALELMFTIESHYVLNNGTYLDNELVDVYLLRKTIHINSLTLQSEEVDSIKTISVDAFCKSVLSKDSSFVPFWKAYQKFLDFLDKENGYQ